jgi:hypothetical protein
VIFPLAAAALSIVIDGNVVRSYNAPYVVSGHVVAPLEPFVTGIAASIGYSGGTLIVTRGDRFAQVPFAIPPDPGHYQSTYVEIAPLLRTLGARVWYDAHEHTLFVETPHLVLATPTPFNPAVPQPAPTAVFTPTPATTLRPIVTGTPSPRRTPLPANAPSPLPT